MFLRAYFFTSDLHVVRPHCLGVSFGLLLSFRTLSTVLRTTLETVSYTCGIQCTTNDVITYTREVFHTTTAYQYD